MPGPSRTTLPLQYNSGATIRSSLLNQAVVAQLESSLLTSAIFPTLSRGAKRVFCQEGLQKLHPVGDLERIIDETN